MRKSREPLNCVGQRFGRLTIIEFAGYRQTKKSKSSMWLCQCDCGNTTTVKRGALTSGNTKSCGCLANELLIQRNKKNLSGGYSVAFNGLYRAYKNGAIRRGLSFEISKENFSSITKMDCVFCGIPPIQVYKTRQGETYVYNGVDRIDNNVGYILENCAPCCKMCNYAKKAMPYKDFVAWIERLAYKFMAVGPRKTNLEKQKLFQAEGE